MRLLALLRILLFPFSVLYGVVVTFRNMLYDCNLLKSTEFDIPVITVGNLSVGGTGKTPQIEYLVRLLQNQYSVAILSRGYKRKSKGFVLADKNSTVLDLGDEPFQYHQKYKNVQVAVHGNRVEGVQTILDKKPRTQVVLLDDAYQHRKIKAGFHILLSSYDKLFYNDFMMPTGNLRELWWGKKRADIIIVTKCPTDLSTKEQQKIKERIKPQKHQQVYFTFIDYAKKVKGSSEIELSALKNEKVILITGIAKPQPLLNHLISVGIDFEHLNFPDHHHFSEKELKEIQRKTLNHKILTTEKDYVRLKSEVDNLFYLPIETTFFDKSDMFDTSVLNFVNQ